MKSKDKYYELIQKSSKLPIKEGVQKTLHLLEAIASIKFNGSTLTTSQYYAHHEELEDEWKLCGKPPPKRRGKKSKKK